MKIIIDTNIILDFFLSREPYAADAKQLFEMIYREKIDAFTTASSITDIYYITAKRLGRNFARGVVKQLLDIVGVVAVDGDDCINAINLPMADFEDALVTICAYKKDISFIVSHDKDFLQSDFKHVKVIKFQELLTLM